MRIGLYGGLANNMYVFAKAFAKQGLDVRFIRDRGDRYPFSQPVWEDVPCTLDYDEVAKAANWTWQEWEDWEVQLGWETPDWYVDPLIEVGCQDTVIKTATGPVDKAICNYFARTRVHWRAAINLMSNCDVLLVCGIEGSILALASGKPFVIVPHGGDIRTAARLHPPKSSNPLIWLDYLVTVRLLRRAYEKALWIGDCGPLSLNFNPILAGRFVDEVVSKLKFRGFKKFPIPYTTRKRMCRKSRLSLLSDTMSRLGIACPSANWIGFVPSRVDFFWKGTDHLFRSLLQIPEEERIHLIVSGWGSDYQKAKEMIPTQRVTFLSSVVSKPILYDFFRAVDFVADQFRLGLYGTTAMEAMSCGAPVIMWIDDKTFRKSGLEPPPILNARNEEDIAKLLKGIISGKIDLEKCSHVTADWMQQLHGAESVVPRLVEQFAAALSGVS